MKNYLVLIAVFVGTVGFAQPSEPEFSEVSTEPTHRAATSLQQQQSFESAMVSAFKTGNAEKIARYFSDNVDLSIDEKEDLYSKSQAEQILKNFFKAHKPSDFKIIHKGKSGQSEYFIGELTSDKVYKVTLNSKSVGGVNRITSLTIAPD
ncbi:MAG: DUF4783 domain-containing protein [Crocinitomicaceae bacterium]|nr:DUF4783 domain-containing protein [Crocinitomicaceae bacterium]